MIVEQQMIVEHLSGRARHSNTIFLLLLVALSMRIRHTLFHIKPFGPERFVLYLAGSAEPLPKRRVGRLSRAPEGHGRRTLAATETTMRTASQAPSRSTALLGVATAAVASAAYVHYRSRQAERDHPPAGKFVSVEGVLLHYVEKGRGEPLVLLHGNTSMSSDFVMSGLVERAAEKYRVIVFDRPGYGWSQRPRGRSWRPAMQAALLQRALQQIDAPRSIVLGHSWGTLVAMAMALDFPRSVRALVLEAGYYYPTPRPDILLGTLPAVPVIGDLLRYTFSPLLLRASWPALARHLFAPAKVPDHFWRFPPWMAFRPSQLRASAVEVALLAPSAARLRHRYRGLTVPTVIVAGHEDRVVSCSSHSGRLARELPHADFRVFPGMGHMLHHLIPGEVLDAIDAAAARQFPAAVCAQSRVE